MATTAPQVQHAVLFPPTLDGVIAAEAELAKIRKALTTGDVQVSTSSQTPSAAAVATAAPRQQPAVVLYDSFDRSSRSRELLEVLTTEGKTPSELATKMKPENGKTMTKAAVRAVYRNLKRKQDGLIRSGKLDAPVVIADFDAYDTDNAGRYSISKENLAALDAHLGR